MNVVIRGMRNAFRNSIRTSSIVVILGVSIGLALTMLVAKEAVNQKITSVKASVGNTISVSPAGVRGFEGGGDALTESDISKVSSLSHVTAVNKTLSDRLTTENTTLESAVDAGSLGRRFSSNSGQQVTVTPPNGGRSDSANSTSGEVTRTFTPPVTVVGTNQPKSLSTAQGGGTFALKSGDLFASDSSENVALVGKSLAEKNSLKVGSTFTAYGTTIKVIGIFDSGNTFSNNQVIMPLKTVQTLSDQAGAITSAELTVDSVDNMAAVTKTVQSKLGSTADVTNTVEQTENSVKPLESIKTIATYSLLGAVACGSLIILLTMVMIVRERRKEIGVLKAIGASNRSIVMQFMSEAVTLTMLGAVVGIAFGIVAANPITSMLVKNSTSNTAQTHMGQGGPGRFIRENATGVHNAISNITASVNLETVAYALLAAVVIALIGSAAAAYGIAKVRPAEVMRTE
jgi:putative ABC transport system permease protein